ncbi:MAG: response regulator [Clostridia bacterium]|nr:response regulator [Clostridia bacterium]
MIDFPAEKKTVLIVDDTAFNRELLTEILEDEYEILEAENGVEAIKVMEKHREQVSLVLLDVVMPEMDGFSFLEYMNLRGWIDSVPVIMISSENTSDFVDRAYQLQVTDFISRPFDTSIVRRRTANTITLYAKQRRLEEMVNEQIRRHERSNRLMISILSQLVEFRNGESGLHIVHIRAITELLLRRVNWKMDDIYSDEDISRIAIASALHDIGKISTPEEILNKPGRLTAEEFTIMKEHAAVGAEMLKKLQDSYDDPLLQTAYEICRWHHERYDGRGYPDGLKGDQIPIHAQVVALADVYDALTSERCYKKAFSHETAMEMILGGKCGAFHPTLLACLQEIAPELPGLLKGEA